MNLPIIVATALVASIVAGGLLTGVIALLLRLRSFDATTRHALWFATLVAIALLPLAGIVASTVQTIHIPSATQHVATTATTTGSELPSASRAPSKPAASSVATTATGHVTSASGAQRSSSEPAASSGQTATAGEPRRPMLHVPAAVAAASLALLAFLAVVALAGLIGLCVSVVRIGAVKHRSSPLDETLANDLPWLTETHRGRETYLRLSYEIEAPVAIGFNRPVILIPTELASKSGLTGIEDLVIHEHAHLRRYDDYTNLVQRVIERVFWFNPFVWIVGRRIALEREIAADDAVVARTADRTRYADALWRLAREMRMPAHTLVAPGALFTRKQISVRIEALLAPGRAQLRRLGPASAAVAIVAGLLSCAIVAVAAPPLELSAPAPIAAPPASTTSMWHALDTRPPNVPARTRSDDVVALKGLSELISSQLSDVEATTQNPDAARSVDRLVELQREVTRLREKLAFMQRLAEKAKLADLQQHIASLAGKAQLLDEQLGMKIADAQKSPAPPAATASAPPAYARPQSAELAQRAAAPARPAAPAHAPTPHVAHVANVDANASETEVNVPPIDVNVPGVSVHVPPVHVHVPAVSVHVPAVSVHVPPVHGPSHELSAALDNPRDASNTTLTRTLIMHCEGCDLSGRDLRNFDLHGVTLTGIDLSKADLRGANLRGANLSGADLRNANLDGADLTDARFSGTDIAGASFHGAQMKGVRFVGISLQGSNIDAAGIRDILLRGCSGCDLSHMELRGIDLHDIRITGADFGHTDLTGANLSHARFSGVSFDNAVLDRADLRNAELTGCSMHKTSLQDAKLDGIRLSGTSLGE